LSWEDKLGLVGGLLLHHISYTDHSSFDSLVKFLLPLFLPSMFALLSNLGFELFKLLFISRQFEDFCGKRILGVEYITGLTVFH